MSFICTGAGYQNNTQEIIVANNDNRDKLKIPHTVHSFAGCNVFGWRQKVDVCLNLYSPDTTAKTDTGRFFYPEAIGKPIPVYLLMAPRTKVTLIVTCPLCIYKGTLGGVDKQ